MYESTLYFNPNKFYVINKPIVEWDMEAASVAICDRYKLLPKDKINALRLSKKEDRTRQMGLLQRDKEFSDKLIRGIIEMRQLFIDMNNISDDEILSLHSDALILNTNRSLIEDIQGVTIRPKNRYTSYLRYDGIEMFYVSNNIENYIEYKGASKYMLDCHTLGLTKVLTKFFKMLEDYDPDILRYLRNFETEYRNDQAPPACYIRFGKTVGDFKYKNLKLLGLLATIAYKEGEA